MAPTPAKAVLHNLDNSDGSVLYTAPNTTHTLQSAVHYPLEVPYRSDEIPTDTYIEVSFRPHNAVAMVKERHIERIVQRVLKSIILGEETPRCMLQITIQVLEVETDEDLSGGVKSGGQGERNLDMIVGAVNASVLACLDGGVQMQGYAGAVLVGLTKSGDIKVSPSVRERKECTSLHVLGYNSELQCILMESEGQFEIEDLEMVEKIARLNVCGAVPVENGVHSDVEMRDGGNAGSLFETMRMSVHDRVTRNERWKL